MGALLLLLLVGPAARAQSQDPEVFIKEGNRLRAERNPAAAYEAFMKAYSIARTPRTAAQLGLCEFDLRHWVEAERRLDEALSSSGHPWLESNRKVLSQALADVRGHLGRVQISGSPAGAEVAVAGATAGRLPLSSPVRVAEGEVEVSVTARGHRSERRTVKVGPGDLVRVNVDLEQIAPVTPEVPIVVSKPTEDHRPSPPPPRDSWVRPVAWTSAAGAVVFAGGGVAALLASRSKYLDYNHSLEADNTVDHKCNVQAPNDGGGPCRGLISDARLFRNLAIGSFAVAGAASVASVVLFTRETEHLSSSGRMGLACHMSVGVWGARCSLSF